MNDPQRVRLRAIGFLAGLCLVAGMVGAQPVNDNFANATVITGGYGTTNVDNTQASAQAGEPPHAGFRANASVWYQWRAPADGEMTMDTLSTCSAFTDPFTGQTTVSYLDTVLAVYTGADVGHLTQIAANDDQFPIQMLKITGFDPNFSGDGEGLFPTGPSLVRFNAVSNTVYYVAVDTKPGFQGNLVLNWAYHSSGVFRWATEQFDSATTLPVFVCTSEESFPDDLSTWESYYQYGVPGVLVTVSRVGGSTGRVLVDYATQDGTVTNAATAGTNYTATSGTLVFEDNEMTKSILIPILGENFPQFMGTNSVPWPDNYDFNVVLSNPRLDPAESTLLSPPRLDSVMTNAIVRMYPCTRLTP